MTQNDRDQVLRPPVSEQDHIEGAAQAPITLVAYGDFECPGCGGAYPIVKEIQQRLGNRLRFVFRHYPLPQHPHAEHVAEAAEAAGAQGKFWEMHDYLYEHQNALSDRHLVEDAQTLGLNTTRFTSEMEQGIYASQVAEDIESGDLSGVQGTPSFYINGALYAGSYELPAFLSALEHTDTH